MIKISEIRMELDFKKCDLEKKIEKVLRVKKSDIKSFSLCKKSIDSRHKNDIFFSVCVLVDLGLNEKNEDEFVLRLKNPKVTKNTQRELPPLIINRKSTLRPVVCGFGPAGMFSALFLARNGFRPIVVERGDDVKTRTEKINSFFSSLDLDPDSNVQFGEGGAGTFSDGKLTTGIKSPFCKTVFEEFFKAGAPEEILFSATPHIGTDKLKDVVKNIREEIISLGGEVHFKTRLVDIITYNGFIQGVKCEHDGKEIDFETDAVVFAVGHSARDTVKMLLSHNIKMEQKPFSIGARIEHRQKDINNAQYGKFANNPNLPAAVYKLACHGEHERGAYTFCMCPGGTVINATSEKEAVVTNGMSEFARDKENANSAILVNVFPEDFPGDDPLSGFLLQRKIEHQGFLLGGGDYKAPAQTVADFLNHVPTSHFGHVTPSFPTGVKKSDLHLLLPKNVTDKMEMAISLMGKRLSGFDAPDAVLTGPESRSSSPVRILRDDVFQTSIRGIYPCGEGAGYAGGIVSAAVDGIRCAYAVMADEH